MFGNEIGFFAFLFLIPFFILYLRRPKPEDKSVPSLMFIMGAKGRTKRHALFQKIVRNLLFIIQLLALLGLMLSATAPLMGIPFKGTSLRTVFVIDASASSQTMENGKTRFEEYIDFAESKLSNDNSIILAEHVPLVVVENANRKEAQKLLEIIEPKETATNIGDAILSAGEIIKGPPGRVIVLSDFLNNMGADPLVAKRLLTAKGIDVVFINKAAIADNIGFIDMKLEEKNAKVTVKNFNNRNEQATIKLMRGTEEIEKRELNILPFSLEILDFPIDSGVYRIVLEANDDLTADNQLYISAPERETTRILLITNKKDNFLVSALSIMDNVEVQIAEPPVIPEMNHDIIFLSNLDENLVLPDMSRDILKKIKTGTPVVVFAQKDLGSIAKSHGLDKFLPVTVEGVKGEADAIAVIENQFTKGIDFGHLYEHLNVTPKGDAKTFIETTTGIPLMTTSKVEGTDIIYYGFIEKKNDFSSLVGYPLFWNNMIKVLMGTTSIDEFNYKTGKIFSIPKQKVKTPSAEIKVSRLLVDEVGIYEFEDGKQIAVNLLNEEESEINSEEVMDDESSVLASDKEVIVDYNLEMALIIFGVVFLLLELFVLKRRGEL